MTTHPFPLPPRRKSGAFTLIELLVVIAIIALLAAVSIPIFGIMSQSGHSTRSVANLKNIGSAFSAYAADNDNYLPPVTSEEELDWKNMELEIDDDGLEQLPFWARTLIHFAAKSNTDLTSRALSCPGLGWENGSGERLEEDSILLAYGVTEALFGFDGEDNQSDQEPRKVPSIENLSRTIVMLETKQDGSRPMSYSEVSWSDALRDFGRPTPGESTTVDFRFKKTVNCLMADGTVQQINHKEGDNVKEPHWTGLDYDTIVE